MKKITKIVSLTVATVCSLAVLLTGCKDTVSYEKYSNAKSYQIGSVSFTADKIKEIDVDWIGGTVEIEQSTSGEVQIIEEEGLETDAERMHYYLDERTGELSVKYCESGLRGTVRESNKNLRIVLPSTVSLEVDAVSAKVTVGSVILKEFSIENVSGNVIAERIECVSAEFDTVSGEVQISELVAGECSIETVSGNVSVAKTNAKALEFDSVSGELRFGLTTACNVDIESTSGNVTLLLNEGLGASIRFKSVSGEFKTEKEYARANGRYDIFASDGVTTDCKIDFEGASADLIIE